MRELLMIAVGTAFINNVVLSQFLGLCAFLGVSKKMDTAAGMGEERYLCYHDLILCHGSDL